MSETLAFAVVEPLSVPLEPLESLLPASLLPESLLESPVEPSLLSTPVVVARELDRVEGKGSTELLGSSMTWVRRSLEVHVDPTASGGRIMAWRKVGAVAIRRAWTYSAAGAMLAVILTIATADGLGLLAHNDAWEDRESAGPARLHYVGNYDGTPGGLHDDCPVCRAMRFAGMEPDETGVAVMTPAKQRVYERKLAEIIAAEGWPEADRVARPGRVHAPPRDGHADHVHRGLAGRPAFPDRKGDEKSEMTVIPVFSSAFRSVEPRCPSGVWWSDVVDGLRAT